MKIIRRGIPPFEATHHRTCGVCISELEFTGADVHWEDGDRPTEPGCHYVMCPVCRERIWLHKWQGGK